MKKEKVILSFIAVLVGLFVAGTAFFLYQSTKKLPESETKIASKISPIPKNKKPDQSVLLIIDTPSDESVFEDKTITLAGKTEPDAIVIVSTELEDESITPTKNGSFSTTITLTDGQNQIVITTIAPSGKETKETRIVTFSTESF